MLECGYRIGYTLFTLARAHFSPGAERQGCGRLPSMDWRRPPARYRVYATRERNLTPRIGKKARNFPAPVSDGAFPHPPSWRGSHGRALFEHARQPAGPPARRPRRSERLGAVRRAATAGKCSAWCRHWHLQEADAQDVTQMVLLNLAAHLARLRLRPQRSFRGWLRTLTQRAWSDFLDQQRRGVRAADSRVFDRLETRGGRARGSRSASPARLRPGIARTGDGGSAATGGAADLGSIPHDGRAGTPRGRRRAAPGNARRPLGRARSIVQKMLRETLARLDASDQP